MKVRPCTPDSLQLESCPIWYFTQQNRLESLFTVKKLADECHNLVCSCNLKLYKPLRISSPLFFSLDYDEDFEGSDAEKEDDYEDDFDDGDKDQSEHSARSPAQSSRRSRSRSPAHSDDEDKTAREVSDVHEFFLCHHFLAIWDPLQSQKYISIQSFFPLLKKILLATHSLCLE